jgi:hypothetical protein
MTHFYSLFRAGPNQAILAGCAIVLVNLSPVPVRSQTEPLAVRMVPSTPDMGTQGADIFSYRINGNGWFTLLYRGSTRHDVYARLFDCCPIVTQTFELSRHIPPPRTSARKVDAGAIFSFDANDKGTWYRSDRPAVSPILYQIFGYTWVGGYVQQDDKVLIVGTQHANGTLFRLNFGRKPLEYPPRPDQPPDQFKDMEVELYVPLKWQTDFKKFTMNDNFITME